MPPKPLGSVLGSYDKSMKVELVGWYMFVITAMKETVLALCF